jgi:protease-4
MKLKEWQKITLLIVIIFAAVGFFMYFIVRSFPDEAPPISRDSFLELTIGGEIPERTVDDPIGELLGEPIMSVESILHVIRKAKIDERIKGIILQPIFASMGLAKIDEIRNALIDFKTTGKPVYAFIEFAGDKEYLLASVADSIFGVSKGILLANGFVSSPMFLKGTLGKLGIEFESVAIGKYKNAPDMFTREDMSDAQREVINSLLDDIYSRYISTLAQARGISEPQMSKLIDQGFFTLDKAKEAGLLDSLMYYNQFKELLKNKYTKRLRFVSFKRYRKIPMSKLGVKAKETIAVVYGVGTIVSGGENDFSEDGLITSEGMANSIRRVADNNSVKAIILRIDSPGGSGTASDIIWREVAKAAEKKPLIVSISDVAASGGYYISMSADSIIAHPSSIVGSIGIFFMKGIIANLYDKIGANVEEIKRGKNADILSELQRLTPDQRAIIRGSLFDFYKDFVAKVAENRDMNYDEVENIAQGRVWTGKQGLENGLVDKLGDFYTAIDMAKKMAGIPVEDYVRLVVYPKQKTLLEKLFSGSLMTSVNNPIEHLDYFDKLPLIIKNIIVALPYFRPAEPLYLCTFYPEIN